MRALLTCTTTVIFIIQICFSKSGPFTSQCLSGVYAKRNHSIPWYDINLDKPANIRWSPVILPKRNAIVNLLREFKALIRNFTHSDYIVKLLDKDLAPIASQLPQPFQDEIKSIANMTGLPLGEVVLYNIFYEVFSVCTSIVAQDAQGVMYHARNLDFGLFMGWDVTTHQWFITETLRPAIVNINFWRDGQLLFRSTSFAGYVGMMTAMRPHVYSLTLNERFNINGGYLGIIEWLIGRRDAEWTGFLTRRVMETAASFETASAMLSNVPIMAPAYFILSGNASGCARVLTRNREGVSDIWVMGDTRHLPTDNWFLLQTNYDNQRPPPFFDDRRTPGNRCMANKTRKGVSFSSLYDVLSSRPNLNKLTTYTTLMQVNTNRMETYIRYCPDPCPPF